MLISIVVTSFDIQRLDDIHDLLNSIGSQTIKNYELVYVTEGSDYLHRAIEKQVSNLGLPSVVIRNDGKPGLAEARNMGAKVATGQILGFVDDDVVLNPNWTQVVENTFRAYPSIVAITGPAYPCWVGEAVEWLPLEFDWLIGCTRWFRTRTMVPIRNCWGMNMAVLKKSFDMVGGFSVETGYHKGPVAEDVELSLRLNEDKRNLTVYVPQMLVWSKVHPYRLSDQFVIERSRWIGYSRRFIRKHYSRRETNAGSPELLTLVSMFKAFALQTNRGHVTFNFILKRYRLMIISLSSVFFGRLFGPRE